MYGTIARIKIDPSGSGDRRTLRAFLPPCVSAQSFVQGGLADWASRSTKSTKPLTRRLPGFGSQSALPLLLDGAGHNAADLGAQLQAHGLLAMSEQQAVLSSTEMGASVYQRIGFRMTEARINRYLWRSVQA